MLRRTGPVPKTHSTLSFHSITARTHHCSTPLYKALLTHSQALWLLLPNHQPPWFTEPHNSQPKLSSAHIKFRAAGYSQAVSFLQIKDPNLNLCVRYSMWVSTLQAHWHREAAMIWEMLRGGAHKWKHWAWATANLSIIWVSETSVTHQKGQLTSIHLEPKNMNSITFFSEPQKHNTRKAK